MLVTTVAVLAGSFVIAALMEGIKYKVYDNEAEKKKMRRIAWGLSIALTPVLYYGFEMLGKPVAMILYCAIIFLVQKEINMELVRPRLKVIIEKFIERKIERL
jgi:methenyltetrahydromethanopterin cyclohydrolase